MYAAVSHRPPFWLALPAADPRFSEAVRAAVSAEEELVEFTTSEDGGLPASVLAAYPPGSIMIDIGADIGLFALQLAALTWYRQLRENLRTYVVCSSEVNATTLAGTRCTAAEGRFTVVAFEPRPDRALLLHHSAARNCFTNLVRRIHVRELVVTRSLRRLCPTLRWLPEMAPPISDGPRRIPTPLRSTRASLRTCGTLKPRTSRPTP